MGLQNLVFHTKWISEHGKNCFCGHATKAVFYMVFLSIENFKQYDILIS